MGWNSVAVILHDHQGDSHRSLARLDRAMRDFSMRDRIRLAGDFGFGSIISQDHADGCQVVIVGRNHGCRADEAESLSWMAADQMIRCLERNGYRVTKRRKPKPALTPPASP